MRSGRSHRIILALKLNDVICQGDCFVCNLHDCRAQLDSNELFSNLLLPALSEIELASWMIGSHFH